MRLIICSLFFIISTSVAAQPVKPEVACAQARAIQVPALWSSYSLWGNDMVIHQWEASPEDLCYFPDTNHMLFKDRIKLSSQKSSISSHATAMAKIMMGYKKGKYCGIAPRAKVMAHGTHQLKKSLLKYARQGMKLGVHAYAQNWGLNREHPSRFWYGLEEVDSTEDYHWGLYDEKTRVWDSIAKVFPHYTAIKSAGNSRGEYFAGSHYYYKALDNSSTADSNYTLAKSSRQRAVDGGYAGFDCLPPLACAKNIITVGAVSKEPGNEKMILQPGSACGPTDDGRIKPDVVAAGSQTSQSTAAVGGVVALLQQYYLRFYGHYPSSKVIKNLLIQGAIDLGMEGPDFRYGWGMVNGLRSAKILKKGNLIEGSLQNRQSQTYYLRAYSDSVKLTLCWTDPAGKPVPFSNSPDILDNTQAMLVNDLNITLTHLRSRKKFQAFALDAFHPRKGAAKKGNNTDNVEQIKAKVQKGEWYRVTVAHKGTLKQAAQSYALSFSGAERRQYYLVKKSASPAQKDTKKHGSHKRTWL